VFVVGLLSQPGDVLGCLLELLFCQVHIASERMQMRHQRYQNFPQPRRLRVLESFRHRAGDIFLALNNHHCFPFIEPPSRGKTHISFARSPH
jgi:hypothetical protein